MVTAVLKPLQLTRGVCNLAEVVLKYLKVMRIHLTTLAAGWTHQRLHHWWCRQPPRLQICDGKEGEGNRRLFMPQMAPFLL